MSLIAKEPRIKLIWVQMQLRLGTISKYQDWPCFFCFIWNGCMYFVLLSDRNELDRKKTAHRTYLSTTHTCLLVLKGVAVVPDHERLCLDMLRLATIPWHHPPLAARTAVEEDLLCSVAQAHVITHSIECVEPKRRLVKYVPARRHLRVSRPRRESWSTTVLSYRSASSTRCDSKRVFVDTARSNMLLVLAKTLLLLLTARTERLLSTYSKISTATEKRLYQDTAN